MNNNIYHFYNRPEIPFMLDINYKETDVKNFGQATLNSNKFKHKQKHKNRK